MAAVHSPRVSLEQKVLSRQYGHLNERHFARKEAVRNAFSFHSVCTSSCCLFDNHLGWSSYESLGLSVAGGITGEACRFVTENVLNLIPRDLEQNERTSTVSLVFLSNICL